MGNVNIYIRYCGVEQDITVGNVNIYIRYCGVEQDITVGNVSMYKIQWSSTRYNCRKC